MSKKNKEREQAREGFFTALIMIILAIGLIRLSGHNGKTDISAQLPYDIASSLILLAAIQIGIQRWYRGRLRDVDSSKRQLKRSIDRAFVMQRDQGRALTTAELKKILEEEQED